MSDERVGLCGEHCAVVEECDARGLEITRLRAENEKLRAALKPFGDIAKQTEHWSGPPVSVPLYVIRAAAAALKETKDE